ncbi:hypothetical protein MNBD_CPR01-569 [hydrothermal vent metagenome]|uniref:Uncharacterized protein n=1 Tax=hydrothermal vent metagenome TaxID=652676 RepID=A0A3B0VNX3_9ZZZZ
MNKKSTVMKVSSSFGIASVNIPLAMNLSTKFCISRWSGIRWYHVDNEILDWLPKRQPEMPARRIIIDKPQSGNIFDIASNVFCLPRTISISRLQKLIIEHDKIMTLPQVNMMLNGTLKKLFQHEKVAFFLCGGFKEDNVCIGRIGYLEKYKKYYLLLSVLNAEFREDELLVSPNIFL